MKITLEKISHYNQPCKAGVEWLKLQKNHTLSALVKTAIENKPFRYHDETYYPLNFALWALPQLMDKQGAVRYAVYAARLVLKAGDTLSVKAIKAAETWLKNPCEETQMAAKAAAEAAWAAEAARAAAEAAWAAEAAGWAAAEAAGAAAEAAGAAAEAAAKKETQIKILRYGVKLLGGEKK